MTITHDFDEKQWGDRTEDSMGDWDEVSIPKRKTDEKTIED